MEGEKKENNSVLDNLQNKKEQDKNQKTKKEPVYHQRALDKWSELERRGLIKKN